MREVIYKKEYQVASSICFYTSKYVHVCCNKTQIQETQRKQYTINRLLFYFSNPPSLNSNIENVHCTFNFFFLKVAEKKFKNSSECADTKRGTLLSSVKKPVNGCRSQWISTTVYMMRVEQICFFINGSPIGSRG